MYKVSILLLLFSIMVNNNTTIGSDLGRNETSGNQNDLIGSYVGKSFLLGSATRNIMIEFEDMNLFKVN